MKKLRAYVEGFPIPVFTDHSSLVWLQNLKAPSGRLSRWAMSLLAHDIKVLHRPGAKNQVPDTLSRAFESFVAAANDIESKDSWYLNQVARVKSFPKKNPDWKQTWSLC